jgi:hypothetical protein
MHVITGMQSIFEHRLRAAVRAGWWTFLIAMGVVLVQWVATAVFLARQPAWFLRLWGPDMTWAQIEGVVMHFLLVFRVFVGTFAVVLVWASLWSYALRERSSQISE